MNLTEVRTYSKKLLHDLFVEAGFSEEYISVAVRRIERSVYNAMLYKAEENDIIITTNTNKIPEMYSSIFYKVYSNLDPKVLGNTNLIEKVGNSLIDLNEVGYMTSEEMFPGKNAEIKAEIERRQNQKIKRKTSNLFTCGNCGKRKTLYREVQTRSLDEPATLFITCVKCGNKWRKG